MRAASAWLARRAAASLLEPSTSSARTTGAAAWAAAAGGSAQAARTPLAVAAITRLLSTGPPPQAPSLLPAITRWAAALPTTRAAIHTGTAPRDGPSTSSPPPPPRSPSFIRLNSLAPAPGSTRPAKRVGRGIGSGRGKTSGRGHKGQKARSGATPKLGFEGGQTPLGKRLPKRGFVNPRAVAYTPVNVGRLQALVEAGRLDPTRTVTMRELVAAGAVSKKTRHGVKVLGRGAGDLRTALTLEVSAASPAAAAAVEAAGGSITRVYYNALNLRALLRPGWLAGVGRAVPRPAAPPPKRAGLFDKVGVVPPEGGGGGGGGVAEAAVAA